MLTAKSTIIDLEATDQPALVILQPIYGSSASAGQIVGCTIKFIKVQSSIPDIMKNGGFYEIPRR